MIEIENVQVQYESTDYPILNGVDLVVKDNKVVIVGPNGSGKTTLLKAIMGLIPITGGKRKLYNKDPAKTTSMIGVSTNLIDVYRLIYLSTIDVIYIFAKIKKDDPQNALDLFKEFELTDIYNKKIHNLSMGQQKMLGNILAISFTPDLILLDEPFESLDQFRKQKFAEYLNDLEAEILMITHEFSILNKMPELSLYFMLDGKLWGEFKTSQLPNLYISKGIVDDALKVMETRYGNYSVTLNNGDVALNRVSNLNSVLDMI